MRQLRRFHLPSLLCLLGSALALACGSSAPAPTLPDGGPVPDGGVLCTKNEQCPAGEGCIGNLCTVLPCGGCDSDQVCSPSNTCVPAQGATCPTVGGCPDGYICNKNNVCSTPCTIDTDCDMGLVCNSNTGSCAQCVFDSNCTTVQGKPRCETMTGICVACLDALDCTAALGSGHFCDTATYTCQTGCESNSDCNLSNGERCNGATSTTPGMCVQCTVATQSTDCGAAAQACDATGHCVQCTGDNFCGPDTPRCDTTSDTCVQCLPSNNANGADCGYSFTAGGTRDPHDESVCDPTSKSCVSGCASDANCGCPVDPGTHLPTNCERIYAQEHCDTAKTTSADATGATEGACVECVTSLNTASSAAGNAECYCKVQGNQGKTDPSTGLACAGWPMAGVLDGAHCVADACVVGCDADSDCPLNKLCSLSGPTAHTCVECSCANATVNDGHGTCSSASESCGWCNDPVTSGQLGGCGPVANLVDGGSSASAPSKVCDAKTLTCRLKRQDEACDSSYECGDPQDPTIGLCIPGAQFCVKYATAFAPNSPAKYCDPGKMTGRCGIPCNDPQDNTCADGVPCPSQSLCEAANAVDTPPGGIEPSGEYCVSALCTN